MAKEDFGDQHLTQSEAALFLRIEPRTLESWRSRGCGPRFVAYSKRCIRYRLSDLKAWVAERENFPQASGSHR
jgi:hypothetical protein